VYIFIYTCIEKSSAQKRPKCAQKSTHWPATSLIAVPHMPMPPLSPPLVSGESARTGLSVHIWTHALYQHLRYGFLRTVLFPLQTIFIRDHTEYAMLDSCGCAAHLLKIQYTQYMSEKCYKTCNTCTQICLSYAFLRASFF